jgi:hypothetical protein
MDKIKNGISNTAEQVPQALPGDNCIFEHQALALTTASPGHAGPL